MIILLKRTIHALSLITIIVMLGYTETVEAAGQNTVEICSSEYQRRSEIDNGSIRIFIKNNQPKALTISQCWVGRIDMDDTDSKSARSKSLPVIYTRLTPPQIQTGEVGELLIKLRNKVERLGVVRGCFKSSGGRQFSITVPLKPSPMRIVSVAFPYTKNQIYLYLKNTGDRNIKINRVEINQYEIPEIADAINHPVPPSRKSCLVLNIDQKFQEGDYVYISLSAQGENEEIKAHSIVRCVRNFPVAFHSGSRASKYNLDPFKAFVRSVAHTCPHILTAVLMECPLRNHGSAENAARRFLLDREDAYISNPKFLSGLWISIFTIPVSLWAVGELPDILLVKTGPFSVGKLSHYAAGNEEFDSCYAGAVDAYDAVSPNRFWAWIQWAHDTWSNDRYQTRYIAYSAIAAGAKGIIYRDYEPDTAILNSASKTALFSQLNMELQLLKPLLTVGEPVDWIAGSGEDVIAKTLLCGTEKLLLFIFEKHHTKGTAEIGTKSRGNSLKKQKADVSVNIPPGFKVGDVAPFSKPGSKVRWQFKEGILTVQTDLQLSSEVLKISLVKTQ